MADSGGGSTKLIPKQTANRSSERDKHGRHTHPNHNTTHAHHDTRSDSVQNTTLSSPPPYSLPNNKARSQPATIRHPTTPPFSAVTGPSSSPVSIAGSTPTQSSRVILPSPINDGRSRVPSIPAAAVGCKYETALQEVRRRFPYSLGSELLEPPAVPPKKALDTQDAARLRSDIEELYERLLPSKESEHRRERLVKKLEKILNEEWPGNDIKVHVYGSSGNLLATTQSDVDICITTPSTVLNRICDLAAVLAKRGMEKIVCVRMAKVPVVRIWDPELSLACDMNVNNTLALENTRLVKTYMQLDPRVRPLAMIIKYWTRQRVLNEALGSTLTSYTWILLIINFLQTREPPILPSLQLEERFRSKTQTGQKSSFADDVSALSSLKLGNSESRESLLFHFFRFYAYEFDFENDVASVRQGKILSKTEKRWHLMVNNRFCVEEPFNTSRNLGNTMDDMSFRGLHMDLRRAFDHIAAGDLHGCCERYVFPPPDGRVVSRQYSQNSSPLTRSLSQSSRSDRNREQSNAPRQTAPSGRRHYQTARRASSAAAPPRTIPPGLLQPGENWHDTLLYQYSVLQQQKAELQEKLQRTADAANHKIASMKANGLSIRPAAQDSSRYQANRDTGPLSAPLRGYSHAHAAPTSGQTSRTSFYNNGQGSSTNQSVTNPPSPSLGYATPASGIHPRRGLQRSNTSESLMSRSQSQPPDMQRMFGIPRQYHQAGLLHTHSASPASHARLSALYQQQAQQWSALRDRENALNRIGVEGATGNRRSNQRNREYSESTVFPPELVGMVPFNHSFHGYGLQYAPDPAALRNLYVMRPSNASEISSGAADYTPSSRSPSPASFTYAPRDRANSFYTSTTISDAPTLQIDLSKSESNIADRLGPLIMDGSRDVSDYNAMPEPLSFSSTKSMSAYTPPIGTGDMLDSPSRTKTRLMSAPSGDRHDIQLSRRGPSTGANMLQFGDFPLPVLARSATVQVCETPIQETNHDDMDRLQDMVGSMSREGSAALGLGILDTQIRPAFSPETSPSSLPTGDNTPHRIVPVMPDLPSLNAMQPKGLLSPVREIRTPSPTFGGRIAKTSTPKPDGAHSKTSSLSSQKDVFSSPLSYSSTLANGSFKDVALKAANLPQQGRSHSVAAPVNARSDADPVQRPSSGPLASQTLSQPPAVPSQPKDASGEPSAGTGASSTAWKQQVSKRDKRNKDKKKSHSTGNANYSGGSMSKGG